MSYSHTPLISIVLCVYNGEDFLEQQLTSVLQQTYPHFELLILDDHSTDKSWALLQAFASQDNRIKLYRNEANLGVNSNFEKGLQLCSGELISICDQDDIWLPNKLQRLAEEITDHLLIHSSSMLIDENGQPLGTYLNQNIRQVQHISYKAFLEGNLVTGHTCLFKKELLSYLLPFPDHVFVYDWWIGFAASYVGKIKYLDEVLTQYRRHSHSVIQQFVSQSQEKELKKQKIRKQLQGFAQAKFLKKEDQEFLLTLLRKKEEAPGSLLAHASCYWFLMQNRHELYPWYKKPFFKQLNYLRKQCLA